MNPQKILERLRQMERMLTERSYRDVLGWRNKFIVAVDYDGTIVVDIFPESGRLIPGAVEGLRRLKELGGRIVIFSGRTGQAGELNKQIAGRDAVAPMKEFLDANGVAYDEIYTGVGKCVADFFIDDRSVPPFDGNWQKAVDYIERVVHSPEFQSVLDTVRFD